jgi:hypothetical protein
VFWSLFNFLFLVCVFPALEFRFLRYFEVHFPRVSSSFFFFILGGIVWVSGFELTVSHERCCLSTAEFVASIGS